MLSREKKSKTAANEDPFLMRKLRSAMAYANNTCIFSTNKIEDVKRTSGWSLAQQYRYFSGGSFKKNSQATPFSPKTDRYPNAVLDLNDNTMKCKIKLWYLHVGDTSSKNMYTNANFNKRRPGDSLLANTVFQSKPALVEVVIQTLLAIKTRSGNCGERSRLVCKYLWENSQGISSIEVISMTTMDHCFVVVNRSGDINDPDTWGDAWIIDPWLKDGVIFPAREFRQGIQEMREYLLYQSREFAVIGLKNTPMNEPPRECWVSRWIINPATDRYPTDDRFLKIEDCYQYDDRRHENVNYSVKHALTEHKQKLSQCLDEIRSSGLK